MKTVLCEHCAAACCRYLALEIDEPETRRDFDDIRWYLLHEGITVFVEDGDWYLQMAARCKSLRPDNRCASYEKRPHICREYETDACEYHAGDYDYEAFFSTAEELETYARRYLRQKGRKGGRKARDGAK